MPSPDPGQADFAEGLLSPDRPAPPTLAGPSDTPLGRRFDVYRNNVVSGLIDALAETFPASQALVGEDFFRAAASVFTRAAPPRSPVLSRWGAGLPDFLRGFPPAGSVPYLGDVAALEWALIEAYHAADAEAVSIDALTAPTPEAIIAARLTPHPATRVVTSPYPIVSIRAETLGLARERAVDMRQGEDALITRPAFAVTVTTLGPGEAVFLDTLGDGAALGDAAERATVARPAFDLSRVLARIFPAGAISMVTFPDGAAARPST